MMRSGHGAAYKLAPSPQQASLLRSQFDRTFKRRTGYATLDRLLKRLLGAKTNFCAFSNGRKSPLGARLGIPGPNISHLATLVHPAPS